MAKYTFLIPAYKTDFLVEAIESILSQTYPDFCIIISDDCSPNDIYSIYLKYQTDNRIFYQRNKSNIGATNLVHHWNMLLEQCSSEFVIMASDDDLYAPEFLNEIDKLTQHYQNIDLFSTGVSLIDEKGTKKDTKQQEGGIIKTESFLSHFFDRQSVLCLGNYVFRTSKLKSIGGFVYFPLAWKSDTATQISMAKNGVANSQIALFSFRMSGLNISSRPRPNRSRDYQKLTASLQFEKWISQTSLAQTWLSAFRRHLEGEMRTYYWVLSTGQFLRLYKTMILKGWFATVRNAVSFGWGYLKCRIKPCNEL